MALKSFEHYMLRLAHTKDISRVFSDFLEMTICALQLGTAEDRYLEIVRRYDLPDVSRFSEAFAALVIEMTGDGSGLVDVLGEFFMINISRGHNGQFFTPQPICDMMAGMVRAGGTGSRVADCACGSGRTLLAAARYDRSLRFYGADVSRECAHMTAINLCLNGLFGEVAWMDSLSNKFYGGWCIDLHPQGAPYLRSITENESRIVLRLPEITPPAIPDTPKQALQQQLVFNF